MRDRSEEDSVDKEHRRYKKNIRRNAEALAKELPAALKTGRERRAFVQEIVKGHPALKRTKGVRV